MNEEVNRKEVSRNVEKDEGDTTTKKMITRTARFSMNEEATLRKKIKRCNEEALVLKLEEGNNLRIFCSTTAFEGLKKIIENTVSKSKKVENLRNEDQEGRIYSENVRAKEKESRRNQVIYAANIYRTKSSLLIIGPQPQKFMLEVIPIIQLWARENKTAINISDQRLKTTLAKLKVKQQQRHIERQEVKKEEEDYDNTKAIDFVTETKNMEVKLGIQENKKGKSKESVVEENEKDAKGSCSFKKAKNEN